MKAGTPEKEQGRRLTLRAQLVIFGVVLVAVVAVPVLVVEVQRPWDALDLLIAEANTTLGGVKAGFVPEELDRMNAFSLAAADAADPEKEDYLIWSFNMMVMQGRLLGEEEVKAAITENEVEVEDFSYADLEECYKFWEDRFAADPGVLELFRKYKERLISAKENVREGGFNLEDIYVMVDDGKTLAFVLDGMEWYEATYAGLKYDASEQPYFRAYLTNGPGFDSNPRHYTLGVFPKFDVDKWGTWFSVWFADERDGIYNNFSIDFDAGAVKNMMYTVGGAVLGFIVVLGLIIVLITRRMTKTISEPLANLTAASQAVIKGDYDHTVPDVGSQDFRQTIRIFNQMITGLKERLNMKQTLEKLLSKELADQVASHGLVLGGQNVDITNLFTDFAGFSTITHHMRPEDVVNMLNDYFTAMIPIIKKWGGLPDKYIGDAIVAIFGAPVALEDHAERAVAAAIEMQMTMRKMNAERRKQGKVVLEMRIGINSGAVIAGAMGSDLKLEYTTIGETTNLANRMESVAPIGHVLIAGGTYERIKKVFFNGVAFEREPRLVTVKGYAQPVPAYAIHVADLEIGKNADHTGPSDFYIMTKVEKGIKHVSDLTPEDREKFTRVIELKAS